MKYGSFACRFCIAVAGGCPIIFDYASFCTFCFVSYVSLSRISLSKRFLVFWLGLGRDEDPTLLSNELLELAK